MNTQEQEPVLIGLEINSRKLANGKWRGGGVCNEPEKLEEVPLQKGKSYYVVGCQRPRNQTARYARMGLIKKNCDCARNQRRTSRGS